MERVAELRQLALHLLVGLELVNEAALEPAADPGELRLIQRKVLLLGHPYRDVRKLVEPRGTAKLAAARAHAGHHLGLIPCAYPPELDARTEVRGKRGVQLAQVGTLVAREEEDEARAVELPVRPEDLDRQIARTDHLGGGSRRVLLHTLVLVHREEIGAVRLSNDGS